MKQKILFFFYLTVLILPNMILCITENMPIRGKVVLVLLPLGVYWTILGAFPKISKTLWAMFPVLFLGAFNIVLTYLFGRGVIAVDMWLNLTTSSPDEMGEMLSQIFPAVVAVVMIYLPTLIYATYDLNKATILSLAFRGKQKKIGLALTALSLPMMLGINNWNIKDDLFPVNVCYNLKLAIKRQLLSEKYLEGSKDFIFHAKACDTDSIAKVVVLVIGETGRACNWQLYGYDRETTTLLANTENLLVYTDCMSQSNTTHKSVPILLSPATAENYEILYRSKGLLAAYNEAGYHTVFISNQPRNKSFNDHLGEQAKEVLFLRDYSGETPFDIQLLPKIAKTLEKNTGNMLLVIHTYGSHSTYHDRYEEAYAHFTPHVAPRPTKKYRETLVNAYDNTIRYTDITLNELISYLKKDSRAVAMLYTSDHGEDIYDDKRNLFLHASPWPSYYQLHVPMLVWTNETYRRLYNERVTLMEERTTEPIQTDCIFPTILGLGGIETPYGQDSLALTSTEYQTKQNRTYLSDHNEALPFNRCLDMKDIMQMKLRGLRTY